MTRLRATAGITISALALMVATTVGGGALASTPADSAASATEATKGPCPMSAASPGMMGSNGGMMGSGPTATPAALHPCVAAQGIRMAVTLSDMMRIEPAAMTVPVGVPVTFVVTNAGAIRHEFVLGDAAAQQEHEVAMQSMGGTMAADDPDAIGVDPGVTKELTWTFTQPGEMLAGCHVPGHYPAGMKGVITVAP